MIMIKPADGRAVAGVMTRVADRDFGVDEFLARPLTARVATNGPTVRPAWYLWEDGAFWLLTGPWARLLSRVQADPAVAIVVDECDLITGTVRQVIARGQAEQVPFDVPRGHASWPATWARTRAAGTSGSAATCTTTRPCGAPPGCGCGPPG